MNHILHYLSSVAPQIHSMASAMTALCFVVFCITGVVGWVQSTFTGKPTAAWRQFFGWTLIFGFIWALIPS